MGQLHVNRSAPPPRGTQWTNPRRRGLPCRRRSHEAQSLDPVPMTASCPSTLGHNRCQGLPGPWICAPLNLTAGRYKDAPPPLPPVLSIALQGVADSRAFFALLLRFRLRPPRFPFVVPKSAPPQSPRTIISSGAPSPWLRGHCQPLPYTRHSKSQPCTRGCVLPTC